MSVETFIDTNILLYAYDSTAAGKQDIARSVLEGLWLRRDGAVSMQVLQEFYSNVTRKITPALPKKIARSIVNRYASWCVATTPAEIASAFRIEDEARIGFWDALIVAAALKSGAARILSEDLNPGRRIAGILIENPFLPS